MSGYDSRMGGWRGRRAPDGAPAPLPVARPVAVAGIALVLAVCAPLLVGAASAGGSQAATRSIGAPPGPAVERRMHAIADTLATLGPHPWAGRYYEGDGEGVNIRFSLAPGAGVAATWHGCLGLYGANAGQVLVAPDGGLRLRYEQPNRNGAGGFPDVLRPVHWGERQYLIPETKLVDFVNAMHRGREPRTQPLGRFLLREGDEAKAADGLPDLPRKYRDMIRSRPLRARVLAVERVSKTKFDPASGAAADCNYRYRLTLDRGARSGLAAGIEMTVADPSSVWATAVIETVAPDRATAAMTVLFDNCGAPATQPLAGWSLGTGAYAVAVPQRARRSRAGE